MRFEIDLIDQKISSKELKLYQYKEILKTIWPEFPNIKPAFENLFELLENLTGNERDLFYQLNSFQLFLLLIEIRRQTFGSECKLTITNEEEKKVNFDFNLTELIEKVKILYSENQLEPLEVDDFTINFQYPSVKRMFQEIPDETVLFLKDIIHLPTNKQLVVNSNQEGIELLNSLSPKIGQQIVLHVKDIIDNIQSFNLIPNFSMLEGHKMPFNLSLANIIWYLKLFFSEQLNVYYDNVFYLNHLGHIDIGFLENQCSPGEYVYYVKKLEETLMAQKETTDQTSNVDPENLTPDEFDPDLAM